MDARCIFHDPSWWMVAGATAGVAFETKYTILFFLVALVASLLILGPRNTLRTRLASSGRSRTVCRSSNSCVRVRAEKNVVLSPMGYINSQLVIYTPLAAVLWIRGTIAV